MKFASGLYLKIKNTIKSLTINEFVILLIVASSFVSVYLISLFILLLPFYFTFTRQYQKALPKTKGDYSLLIFALYAALVTLIQAKDSSINFFELKAIWLKFLGVGIIVLVFDIFFFKNIMTKRAYLPRVFTLPVDGLFLLSLKLWVFVKTMWQSLKLWGYSLKLWLRALNFSLKLSRFAVF